MNRSITVALLGLATAGLAGCAARKYRPAPVVPAETAARLERRSLRDPGLHSYLEKSLGRRLGAWPLKEWDPATLTLAALYFSPQLALARAQAQVAAAGVVTAGARPNPTVSLQPGIPSPYLFGLNFLFPIQTAGKRGYRIAQAEHLSAAARLAVAEAAWRVRGRVRLALLDHLLAARKLSLLRARQGLLGARARLLDARLSAGEIARPPVEAARIRLSNTRLALRAAEGRVGVTRAALAAAIGIPDSGLAGVELGWPNLARPPNVQSLSPRRIQRDAVLDRLDVRRSLAGYAAAETALRLEIARQYPNFQIGPGYQFEESHNYFTIGLSATLPIFNRNQGPIAQAEARRKAAAAAFLATQARVIAQSEQALAQYRAALGELNEARQNLNRLLQVQQQLVRHAFRLGETDRLAMNQAQLESLVAAQAQLTALGDAQRALGALEDAVQRPLQPGELPAPQGKSGP
jgi:cobalt-zinc-cadmium efflux system outer membrane protein